MLDVLPPVNVKILTLAISNFGRQVGDGECAELPATAMRASGRSLPSPVWRISFGKEIPWEEGRPGDVITFGDEREGHGHIAVLFRWSKTRANAAILHQNDGGVKKVVLGSLGATESLLAPLGQPFTFLLRP